MLDDADERVDEVRWEDHIGVRDDDRFVAAADGSSEREVHVARDADIARGAVVTHVEVAAAVSELVAPGSVGTAVVEHEKIDVVATGKNRARFDACRDERRASVDERSDEGAAVH